MRKKHLLAAAAALAALGVASTASATIYTYTQSDGDVLTINTSTNSGTLVGPDANIGFTGNFSSFTGGTSFGNITLTSVTGTRTVNGVTYTPDTAVMYAGSMPDTLNSSYLWAEWVGPNGQMLPQGGSGSGAAQTGTDFDFGGLPNPTVCTPSTANNQCGTGGTTTGGTTTGGTTTGGTTTGGTTTGGTTTGGTTTGGTTTGGTSVPEPANAGLFGLGVVALLAARRRKARAKA